jgi:hypothetical protein
MRRWLVYGVIVGFWGLMMTSLLVKEGLLFPSSTQPLDYKAIFEGRIPYHEERMGIYFHGKRVGYTSSCISPYRIKGKVSLVVRNLTELTVPFENRKIWFTAEGYSIVDEEWRILKMDYKFLSNLYQMRIKGDKEGDALKIKFNIEEETYTYRIPLSEVSSPSPIFLLPHLLPKRTYTIKFMNPFTQRYIKATLKMEGKRSLNGEDVYVVRLCAEKIKAHLLVKRTGEILKVETPFGWTFIREDENDQPSKSY